MLALVIPLSLLAALLYAFSDFFEQRAASLDARADRPADRGVSNVAGTMKRLIRNRRWVTGWAIGTIALFVQATALHEGSVAVVQTLQVTTLLFAIPLSTVYGGASAGWRDYAGGSLVCVGLVVVIAIRGGAVSSADRRPSVLLFLLVALAVAGLILLAVRSPGPVRVTALATAAGVAFGSSAALVKLTTEDLTSVGVSGTARDWPGYALAVATGAGLVIQQLAFAAGRLAAATTAMLVANPLVGYFIAVVGFGEGLPDGASRLAAVAIGGACATVGITILAHSPVLFGRDDEADDPRLTDRELGGVRLT